MPEICSRGNMYPPISLDGCPWPIKPWLSKTSESEGRCLCIPGCPGRCSSVQFELRPCDIEDASLGLVLNVGERSAEFRSVPLMTGECIATSGEAWYDAGVEDAE